MVTPLATLATIREILTLGDDLAHTVLDIVRALKEQDYETAARIVREVESSKAAGRAGWLASKNAGHPKRLEDRKKAR